MKIILNHSDFIVLNKPNGISFHKDDQKDGFMSLVQKNLGYKLFSVHRLDKVTSGVILFAKSKAVASYLSSLFRNKEIRKTYVALAKGKPLKKQGLIKGDMVNSRRGSYKLLRSLQNPAITRFTSKLVRPGLRLYTLHPVTGKTHQLRVAMKSIGVPILGDKLYGGEDYERVCLHCESLDFDYYDENIHLFCHSSFEV